MVSIYKGMFASLVVCGLAWASPLWARRPETGFLNRTAVVDGVTYKYQVFVPSLWNKKEKWPVILFLHGYGEEGDDGVVQTEVGLATAIRNHVDRFPFVVAMPQCRKKDWWTSPAMEAQALKALDQTIQEFKGDPQRVYLTGLSMGGFGTWAIASAHPGKFAALVPICGGIRLPLGTIFPMPTTPMTRPTLTPPSPKRSERRRCGYFTVAPTRWFRSRNRGRWWRP